MCQARAGLHAQEESSSTGVSDPLSPRGSLAPAPVLLTAFPSVHTSFFHPDACKGPCTNVMALFLEVWVSTFLGVFLPPLLSPETLIYAHDISFPTYLNIWPVLVGRNASFCLRQGVNRFCVLCTTSRDPNIRRVLHNQRHCSPPWHYML